MTREEALKRCLFQKCESKEALHRWIRLYLHFDLPSEIVHPESNSSPMDFIWEVYSKAIEDNDPKFTRILGVACRDGYKSLSGSILEVLLMLHAERSSAHLAALESQSTIVLDYAKNWLGKPYINEFIVGDNKREVEVLRYLDPVSNFSYTEKEFKEMEPAAQQKLVKKHNKIKVVICTKRGANGLHAPAMCIDEVDLADSVGYKEAQLIPGPWGVKYPITFLVSTRKSMAGLVQKEINDMAKTGMHYRHWNIIDVTKRCEPERHLPNLPKVDLWVNDDSLSVYKDSDLQSVPDKDKEKLVKVKGYAGCENCKIFAACKGLLANRKAQKPSNPNAEYPEVKLLKDIDHVIASFAKVSPELANAQLMCRAPENTGIIYSKLDRSVHVKSADWIYEKCFGEKPTKKLSKTDLINASIQAGATFATGIDFGFAHDFAAVTIAIWGQFAFVIDSIAIPGLELDEKIESCSHLKALDPLVFPDPEDPSSARSFQTKGKFRVQTWQKGPGSVKGGIETVRSKLKPTNPTLFFLADDENIYLLVEQLLKYHFKQDAAGNILDQPDKDNNDSADAVRYAVMNAFDKSGKVIISTDSGTTEGRRQTFSPREIQQNDFLRQISENFGVFGAKNEETEEKVTESGSILFDFDSE